MFDFLKILAQGDVTPIGILLLIIVCLITGRLIPYWQVQDLRKQLRDTAAKLAEYEEKAPQLLLEVQKLISLQQEENERALLQKKLKAPPKAVARVKKSTRIIRNE